jgi:exodeoxyribonuclease VII large subunit
MYQRFRLLREHTSQLSKRLVHPSRQLADYRLRLDDALGRIVRGLSRQLDEKTDRLNMMRERLGRCSPEFVVEGLCVLLKHHRQRIFSAMQFFLESRKGTLRTTVGKLKALNPLAILERGYSVTQTLPDYALLKDVRQVSVGQGVKVTVSRGAMVCRIERKQDNGQANI